MNKECEIVRDILPLYVDNACSESSREIIEEHLGQCPDCAAYLSQIQTSEAEEELRDEKTAVISQQARRFRRRSTAVGSTTSALFMIPILACMIVNLVSGRTLDWFFVVMASMLVAASVIVVPLMVPENKLFWTFCAFVVSLIILLAVCCLYSGGTWFFVAASASLFGLSVIFLPFVIRAKPLEKWVAGHNKTLLVLAVDGILFGSMMNVISLHQKGIGFTVLMAVLVAAALGLLGAKVIRGRDRQ